MGIYNFHKRFVPMILAGEKTHTIRAPRKHPDKPGKMCHLYTGLRQEGARLLMRRRCVKIEEITIADLRPPIIYINGEALSHSEEEAFARRDGFKDFADMLAFWNGRLPFEGHVIHWEKRPFGGEPI